MGQCRHRTRAIGRREENGSIEPLASFRRLSYRSDPQREEKIRAIPKPFSHSALKTICAFLNSKGGTLPGGVHDSGEILGIEPADTLCGNRPNSDGFELKLNSLLKDRFSPLPTDLDVTFFEVDGRAACHIHVPANARPHYLDNKLYIRLRTATEELTPTPR